MARLCAEFDLSGEAPLFVEGPKYKHYRIRLSVKDAPIDALTIIYQLDSSYDNPVRMVTKGSPDFQEYITSYGDYEITIVYRPVDEPSKLNKLLSQKLSAALRDTYGAVVSVQVELAIRDIELH